MGQRRFRRMRQDEPMVDGLPAQGKVPAVPCSEQEPHARVCQPTCSAARPALSCGTDSLRCQRWTCHKQCKSERDQKLTSRHSPLETRAPTSTSVCVRHIIGTHQIALHPAELYEVSIVYGKRQLILSTFIRILTLRKTGIHGRNLSTLSLVRSNSKETFLLRDSSYRQFGRLGSAWGEDQSVTRG